MRRLLPRRRPGLTARVTVVFGVTAFASSLAVATITYVTARNSLVDQRLSAGRAQALNNAQLVSTVLSANRDDADRVPSAVRTDTNGFAVVHLAPEDIYYAQEPLRFNQTNLPDGFVSRVNGGVSGEQRFTFNGVPYQAVGLYLSTVTSSYFEAFSLSSTERTLSLIFATLATGVVITSILGAVIGLWASRRLLRPLSRVSAAASEIANGGLDVRLEPETDPELNRLAMTFNDMADSVQQRIEREARFASDVSHELRTPITALVAAVGVLDAKSSDLSERNRQAVKLLVGQTQRFERMVTDLLELARLDASVEDSAPHEIEIGDFLRRLTSSQGCDDKLAVDKDADQTPIIVDRRRLERVIVNLIANAQIHGGGVTRISAALPGDRRTLRISVEDGGPGVPPDERESIFDRFTRGSTSRQTQGTGLGLALVREHVTRLGGRIFVDPTLHRGARFVCELPVVTLDRNRV